MTAGTDVLYSGTAQLLSGTVEFYEATGTLKDGTSEMREETDGMDTEISDKNTNIEAVQFVIHTEFITILETVDEIVPEEEKSSFLDKLIDLFR